MAFIFFSTKTMIAHIKQFIYKKNRLAKSRFLKNSTLFITGIQYLKY